MERRAYSSSHHLERSRRGVLFTNSDAPNLRPYSGALGPSLSPHELQYGATVAPCDGRQTAWTATLT